MKMQYHGFFRYFKRVLGMKNNDFVPRKVTIRNFIQTGCIFEIISPIESFRIEQYGNEEDFTRLILEELTENDIFYDIGASVGLVSIHAAKKCKYVFAFEPDPSIRSRLERNMLLNSFEAYPL